MRHLTPPDKISNRAVADEHADEHAAVSAKIDALYGQQPELPADYETTGMAPAPPRAHTRMLGNGLCTGPAELDCRLESARETRAFFRIGPQFLPSSLASATTPSTTTRPTGPRYPMASHSPSGLTGTGSF